MKSINQIYESEYIIEKSRFITILSPIHKKDDVDLLFSKVRIKYPNATHYCHAYILDSIERCSDDGEPSGTAGMPILNVLKMQEMNHIIAIVIRYFGGIKLGAGGLVRAYTKSVTTALEKVTFISYTLGNIYQISFPYDNIKSVTHFIDEKRILNKKYNEDVCYQVKLTKKEAETLLPNLQLFGTKIQDLGETYITE